MRGDNATKKGGAPAGNRPPLWPSLNERNDMTDHIPQTALTDKLRCIWQVLQDLGEDAEPFEDYYRRQCAGGSPNGRALAAVLFDRARRYWPDFFSPADIPALAVWGDIFDTYHPFATPEVVEMAVDDVHARGIKRPGGPAYFLQAVDAIQRQGGA